MEQVLLLGDSLTQEGFKTGGWAARLADTYVRRADVLNRGLSGYNSRWALDMLQGERLSVDAARVRLATVFFGANDAAQGAQAVPVAEYESNVAQLVQALRALNASVRVVVIAPPPVDAASYVAKFITPRALQKGLDPASVPVDRSDERVVPYVEACRRVAEAQGVPLVDTFAAIHAAARKGAPLASFFSDGLHLSAEGNAVVYDTLAAAIKQHAPELHVRPCPFTGNAANSGSSCDALSPMAPFWDKIDPAAGAGRFLDAHFAASPRSPKRQRREV